jgi:hypothetical protein
MHRTAIMNPPQTPRVSLAQRLRQPGLVVAPGVHDMVSLRLADSFGFDALYMTGFGTVASSLGLPDAGIATYTDMVQRVRTMASMATVPLIADGDTGYGGLLNVAHTVRGYEAAGAAAIQLEDQEFPKKCGHTPGRRVVPMADMVRKIRVACEARASSDFPHHRPHRRPHRAGPGRSLAPRRGLRRSRRRLSCSSNRPSRSRRWSDRPHAGPAPGGQHGRGRPHAGAVAVRARGDRLPDRHLPGDRAARRHRGHARYLCQIRQHGSSPGLAVPLMPFGDLTRLMGFEEVWDFDRRHAETP